MLVKYAIVAAAFAAMSGAAIAAPVATLSDVAGTVLVDQGRGFVRISADSAIASGSRVMLSRDGRGTLVYAGVGGCKLKLSANTITTVSSIADCHPVSQVAGQAPPPPPPPAMLIVTGLGMAGIEATAETIAVLDTSASD